MSIPFTLEGAIEKYNALFTEEGYDQWASTETYTLIAKSKEKGYIKNKERVGQIGFN